MLGMQKNSSNPKFQEIQTVVKKIESLKACTKWKKLIYLAIIITKNKLRTEKN